MKTGYFIAGTDTGIGKTTVSCALLHAFALQGKSTAGMKPVAAAGDDAERLLAASSVQVDRALANPYSLAIAAAPHIAAQLAGTNIDIKVICDAYRRIEADAVIVEGVGGFCVPLNPIDDTADMARALALPVILVVGIRLGCINHALLTAAAIARTGLSLDGWVANLIDPQMAYAEENIEAIGARIDAPLLGSIPFSPGLSPLDAAQLFDLSKLRNA